MILRVRGQHVLQAAMRLGERMIGHARQQMVQRVIAQAHRRPQFGQQARRRNVDAVEELAGHGQHRAVIFPEMRDERADLVEHQSRSGDRAEDDERAQRHPAENARGDQQGRPRPRAAFLPRPLTAELTLGRLAAEQRVDDHPRIAFDDDPAQRRDQERQRGEHRIAEDERHRRERRGDDEQRHRPRLHQRERQIFGVLDRAIFGAIVVQAVDAFVHERRNQHRHADEDVPAEAEARQRIFADMRQFVDEAARAVERDDRNQRGDQHPRGRGREDRRRDAGIADKGRGEHIGPIDTRARLHEIARQLRRRADHRHIVGNRRLWRFGNRLREGSRDPIGGGIDRRHTGVFTIISWQQNGRMRVASAISMP
eukprot:Opistho-1_new@31559